MTRGCTVFVETTKSQMATDAVRSQVAAKWQESFNRLNGSAPGISGLLSFSEVCVCILLEKHLSKFGK
jgi:hypothetical protein